LDKKAQKTSYVNNVLNICSRSSVYSHFAIMEKSWNLVCCPVSKWCRNWLNFNGMC